MTSRERQTLKQLVDEARREQERLNRQAQELVCKGCGIDFDTYTTGCRQCISRRYSRIKKGYRQIRNCLGCGGNLNDLNPGCQTCRERSKARGFGRNGDHVPAGMRAT